MKVVDTHTFIGHFDGKSYTPDDFKKARDSLDIDIQFIPIAFTPYDNEEIGLIAQDHQDIFAGAFLNVVPNEGMPDFHTPIETIEELITDPNIISLKFMTSIQRLPINDPRYTPYIELAAENGASCLFHCSSKGTDYTSPEKNREMVQRHPNTTIIFAHLVGLHPEYSAEGMKLAREFDNVYFNTTGVAGLNYTYEVTENGEAINGKRSDIDQTYWTNIVKEVMADPILRTKALFGTDYPETVDRRYSLSPLDQLTEQDVAQIIENTYAAFNLS